MGGSSGTWESIGGNKYTITLGTQNQTVTLSDGVLYDESERKIGMTLSDGVVGDYYFDISRYMIINSDNTVVLKDGSSFEYALWKKTGKNKILIYSETESLEEAELIIAEDRIYSEEEADYYYVRYTK